VFATSYSFNYNISTWNTSKVKNMNHCFRSQYDNNKMKFYQPDIFKWDVTNLSFPINYMFTNNPKMEQYGNDSVQRYRFNLLQNGRFEENTINREYVDDNYYINITNISGWDISNSGTGVVNVIYANNIINDLSLNVNKWQIDLSGIGAGLYQDINVTETGRYYLEFYIADISTLESILEVTMSGPNYLRQNEISGS
jgi:hypothetical protein